VELAEPEAEEELASEVLLRSLRLALLSIEALLKALAADCNQLTRQLIAK